MSKVIHYTVLALLLAGGLAYWWMKPPGLNPMLDSQAAGPLALVQTHRAAGYPTILQAFNERARIQEARKLGLRLGEWKVIKQDGQRYEVRIYIRKQDNPVVRTGFHLARGSGDEARQRGLVAGRQVDAGRPESGRPRAPGGEVPSFRLQCKGVFTCTFVPCTLTSTQATRISGFSGRSPVPRTLNRHPCQGHSTSSPSPILRRAVPLRAGMYYRRHERFRRHYRGRENSLDFNGA
ncbi:MAG: hypothetical protein IPJ44_20475, partial [Nitrospira sp.]|nr:hypothetical protein [Nitrospira sp.]